MVYIARALVGEPDLMILDEPESHLDFKNQFRVLHLIERLNRERQMSFIINTHYPDHALHISDYALMLGGDSYVFGPAGEIISEENVEKIFGVSARIFEIPGKTRPAHVFTVVD